MRSQQATSPARGPDAGESGIITDLLRYRAQNLDPLTRGLQFLARTFDIETCYQIVASRRTDFEQPFEVPVEIFSTAMALDIIGHRLSPRIVRRMIVFLCSHHENGLFSFFCDPRLLPCDIDDTGLALSCLVDRGAIDIDVATAATLKVIRNCDARGIMRVYLPPRGERQRTRVDPICCAHALYLAFQLGLEAQAEASLDFVHRLLENGDYLDLDQYVYYHHPEFLPYCLSRLLRFRGYTAHAHILRNALLAAPIANSSVLSLAMRVITSRRLGLDHKEERKQLLARQRADGSWPIERIYSTHRSQLAFGSAALVTAFALRALDDDDHDKHID